MRRLPNIIITGTPGVGKTTHCAQLKEISGLRHLEVNKIVEEGECHDGWDKSRQCWIVDEDRLLNVMENDLANGGCIIDWHACDMFPAQLIDLVVVLRTDSVTLYDRLLSRRYPDSKLQENLDSEIMDVLIQEALGAFGDDVVLELKSVSNDDMKSNVAQIIAKISQWKEHNNRL